MEQTDQTFLEKAEEAIKRIDAWPDWKKKLYENISKENIVDSLSKVVSTIDESAFRSRIRESFKD